MPDGAVLLAYVDRQASAVLEHAPEDFTILAHAFPTNDATIVVAIEWSRLHLIKRYVTPSDDGGVQLQVFGKLTGPAPVS